MIIATLVAAYAFQRMGGCCRDKSGSQEHGSSSINSPLYWRVDIIALFLIMVAPAILVAGFRYGISVDYTGVYEKGFHLITEGDEAADVFEPGFKAVVLVSNMVVGEPWFMFMLTSCITIVLVFLAIRDSSSSFVSSVVLFFALGFYFDSFNGIRQYVAVAILLFSYKFVARGDALKYAACIVVASMFHRSAIFLLPLFLLRRLNLSIGKWLFAFLAAVLLGPIIGDLTVFIMSNVSKYNEYIVRGTLQNYVSFSRSGFLTLLICAIPCIWNYKQLNETEEGRFVLGVILLGFCFAAISGHVPLAYRILYYFKGMCVICLPNAIAYSKSKRESQTLTLVCVGLLIAMTALGMLVFDWYAVIPYQSIFD